ncbi:MAG: AtpZ/AtpI family protein [Acidobacteria bacterium]|nr:AtpZ/AtpI family protein [Acidobacteriota bacterium]MBI3484270.1 AtpZ/AtpI family protein [Acidobacteriota bacterium]
MPSEPPRKRTGFFLQTLAMAMELPFILVAGVVIGGGAGYWLDSRFHTSPLLTFVLGILGFGAGVREVIRRIPKDVNQNDDR